VISSLPRQRWRTPLAIKPSSEDPLKWAFWAQLLETIDVRRASRIDVALIEAIMLFPDDEVWRAKAAISSFVEWVGDGAAEFSQEALVMLQRITRAALRPPMRKAKAIPL
jgi:hypothetical protein